MEDAECDQGLQNCIVALVSLSALHQPGLSRMEGAQARHIQQNANHCVHGNAAISVVMASDLQRAPLYTTCHLLLAATENIPHRAVIMHIRSVNHL